MYSRISQRICLCSRLLPWQLSLRRIPVTINCTYGMHRTQEKKIYIQRDLKKKSARYIRRPRNDTLYSFAQVLVIYCDMSSDEYSHLGIEKKINSARISRLVEWRICRCINQQKILQFTTKQPVKWNLLHPRFRSNTHSRMLEWSIYFFRGKHAVLNENILSHSTKPCCCWFHVFTHKTYWHATEYISILYAA